ncbi:MAG: DNA polymerase IV [Pseudomonadota bacterium]
MRNGRCVACNSVRIVQHAELDALTIAHVDCDAFYAAVEKRDNPDLIDKPVIIGGGQRGVVSTACYVARINGVHSAMPMFKALKACPGAVVIKPDMKKYVRVGREIRNMMLDLTPLVEPISIDEAFLDLSGTARVHGMVPAATMATFARTVEREVGITVSVGLSHNKFLAKIASDQDKPRGYFVIGKAETERYLATLGVDRIWGVGKETAKKLKREGFVTIADLQRADQKQLAERYGSIGLRLFDLAHGHDTRSVSTSRGAKSVSSETTFNTDISDHAALRQKLWLLCEKVSARLKDKDIAGRTVTLKLKTARFALKTRSHSLEQPTQMAERIFRVAETLLERETDGTAFRLIGVGVNELAPAGPEAEGDLFTPDLERRDDAERAVDQVRARFGRDVIVSGRALPANGQTAQPQSGTSSGSKSPRTPSRRKSP